MAFKQNNQGGDFISNNNNIKITYIEINGRKYISRGEICFENGRVEKDYIEIRPAINFGLFDCKYCKRTIKPILSGVWQIVCSKCGYGLTPDFFTEEELRYWIKTGEYLDVEKDGSDELKEKYQKNIKKFLENQEKKKKLLVGNGAFVFVNFISDVKEINEITELIAEGESARVEFKSSLRWDMNKNCVNKELEHVIVKEISGFLNTDGGIILIGVDDDGNIIGLEKDYNSLGKKNRDGFQLQLVQIVSNYIGNEFGDYWRIKFLNVEDKEICAVEVEKSPEPVYTKRMDKTDEDFFIRIESSTRSLSRSEMVKYLKHHFKK